MNDLSRTKKILLILGFLLFIFVCGYALYAVFLKPVTSNKTVGNQEGQTTGTSSTNKLPNSSLSGNQQGAATGTGILPGGVASQGQDTQNAKYSSIANGGITTVSELNDVPSQGATVSSDGQGIQYYNKNDGKFYRVDKNGNITELSDKVFYSVQKITWAPDKEQAVLEYPDNAKVIYDFQTGKQTTVPSHWKDFNFSSDSKQLVMKSMGTDPDNRWLAIVSADGSQAKKIEPLGEEDQSVYPMWSPNSQVVALYAEGIDLDRQEVYFIGQNDENFKSAVVPGRGFDPKWSPKGDKLLYSVYSTDSDLKPVLWIVDANGDKIGSNRTKIGLETWASKCTFADDRTAYCAVPQNMPEAAGLEPSIADDIPDNIYKIDIYSGTKKLIAIPDGQFSITNIMADAVGSSLFFTDRSSQTIHKINLK